MRTTFLLLILLIYTNAFAQTSSTSGKEQLEAYKVGMITQRLNLSADQAKLFWPIYEEYTKQRKVIKKKDSELKKSLATTTLDNKDLLQEIKKIPMHKQQQADLERDYINKLSKVISAKQISELYLIEGDYRKMLIKRLAEGKNNGDE
jgi:Skp family chaperone for outer membrane proteins